MLNWKWNRLECQSHCITDYNFSKIDETILYFFRGCFLHCKINTFKQFWNVAQKFSSSTWSQCHQHFRPASFADILSPKSLKAEFFSFVIFCAKILVKNVRLKCWWNWHLEIYSTFSFANLKFFCFSRLS